MIQDVQWLQTITKLPILVKGVLTAEDGEKTLKATTQNSHSSSSLTSHGLLVITLHFVTNSPKSVCYLFFVCSKDGGTSRSSRYHRV